MAIVKARTRKSAIIKFKKAFPISGKRIKSARKEKKGEYEILTY